MLGSPPVDPVPVSLALDASRGRRLVAQAGFRNVAAAALADAVRAVAEPLQRPLDLLPVLVEQVDQKVAGLPVGEGLGQVGLFWDAGDDAAHDVVQGPVQAGLLAALGGKDLEPLAIGLEPLRGFLARLLAICHREPPSKLIPYTAPFGLREQNARNEVRTRSRTITGRMSLQPIPPKFLIAVLVLALLAGCQPSNPHAVPSVTQIGANLKCAPGDHGYEDPQFGWGFCYPSTWRYIERSQGVDAPKGVDLTFDITCLSDCRTSTPAAGAGNNLFGFMIVSTYERGGASDLTGWVGANMRPAPNLETISWGNSAEAAVLPDGRRLALTPHFVVLLDVRSGLLDVADEMASRLDTWKFAV